MTENTQREDTASQPNVPEPERTGKDPLPWLIRNLRQRNEELNEVSRTQESRHEA